MDCPRIGLLRRNGNYVRRIEDRPRYNTILIAAGQCAECARGYRPLKSVMRLGIPQIAWFRFFIFRAEYYVMRYIVIDPFFRGPMNQFALVVTVLCIGFASSSRLLSAERERFQIGESKAFVIMPPESGRVKGPTPWVWYAPTLGNRHPNRDEQWMIDRLHAAGIALAGVDVGESYGSPKGVRVYQEFYRQMTAKRGFSTKPVLLARSRGGLMLYSWAVSHADCVGGIAGIYPVCNIASYPGIERASPAFDLTPEQLKDDLTKYNPVDNLQALAKSRVPVFHIQGDSDNVVPHDKNSGLLASRYQALGGPVVIELIRGQGHNMWRGWFESDTLTQFMIKQALGK